MEKINMNLEKFFNTNKEKSNKKNIKNKLYRQFLDEGIIKIIDEKDIEFILQNMKSRHLKKARSLLICLYYTGARPNEVLRLRAKDIYKKNQHVIVMMKGSKNGLPRTIYLPFRNKPLVKELLELAEATFSEQILFWEFQSRYLRKRMTRKGLKERIEYSSKLRYHFIKWTSVLDTGEFTPYFLRHNRFSKLAMKDVKLEELRMLKGSKSFSSIMPYLHMSSKAAKVIASKLD